MKATFQLIKISKNGFYDVENKQKREKQTFLYILRHINRIKQIQNVDFMKMELRSEKRNFSKENLNSFANKIMQDLNRNSEIYAIEKISGTSKYYTYMYVMYNSQTNKNKIVCQLYELNRNDRVGIEIPYIIESEILLKQQLTFVYNSFANPFADNTIEPIAKIQVYPQKYKYAATEAYENANISTRVFLDCMTLINKDDIVAFTRMY